MQHPCTGITHCELDCVSTVSCRVLCCTCSWDADLGRDNAECCLCTGVDAARKQLLFMAGSTPDVRRQIRVPLAAMRDGRLSIRTDLMDAHLYIFHKRTFFKAVQARPSYTSIRQVTSAAGTGLLADVWPQSARLCYPMPASMHRFGSLAGLFVALQAFLLYFLLHHRVCTGMLLGLHPAHALHFCCHSQCWVCMLCV